MNYSLIRQDARERLRGNWGTGALIVLVYALLSTAIEGIGFVFPGDAFSLIGTIAFIIVCGPLNYGLAYCFTKINRKNKTDVGDLFNGFNNNFSNKISAGVSIYVFTFLWSLLLIIPGIIASYSYSMTYYIMIDNPNMSSSDAIKKSKEMMKGHKMQLFMLDLTFIGWILLGILSLGIGMFWVNAYMETAHARFYEALAGTPEQAQTESEESTTVISADTIKPYTETSDANVVYKLKCDTCGATETHTQKSSDCPYCGGKMKEE